MANICTLPVIAKAWPVCGACEVDEASGRTLSEPEAVTGQSGEVLQMDLSRDGRRIVYTTRIQDANLKSIGFDPVAKVTVGESVSVTRGSRPSGSPNVSPDGQLVVFHSLGAAREDILDCPQRRQWSAKQSDQRRSSGPLAALVAER
jgi:Tol biopolymer transport system component